MGKLAMDTYTYARLTRLAARLAVLCLWAHVVTVSGSFVYQSCFGVPTMVSKLVDGSCSLTCSDSVCPNGTNKLSPAGSPATLTKPCWLEPWQRALLFGQNASQSASPEASTTTPGSDPSSSARPGSPTSWYSGDTTTEPVAQGGSNQTTPPPRSEGSNCSGPAFANNCSTKVRDTDAATPTRPPLSSASETEPVTAAASVRTAAAASGMTSASPSTESSVGPPWTNAPALSTSQPIGTSPVLSQSAREVTSSTQTQTPIAGTGSASSLDVTDSPSTPTATGGEVRRRRDADGQQDQSQTAVSAGGDGCMVSCEQLVPVAQCCPNYYGPGCEACPKSADGSVCNNNGMCSDTIDGTGQCTCDVNFTGTSCEMCSDQKMYGSNCDEVCRCVHGICDNGPLGSGECRQCLPGFKGPLCDQAVDTCNTISCGSFSECEESVAGQAGCVCLPGYESQSSNSSDCSPINPCKKTDPRRLCGSYRECFPTGPGNFDCRCPLGYIDDVRGCSPINPCLTNNGGCDEVSTVCIHTGANSSVCDCKAYYEKYVPGVGCSLKDVCPTARCHPKANCTTTGPNQYRCSCLPGYVGDGVKNCFGNILERLQELNDNHPELATQLSTAIGILQNTFEEPIRRHGPFTVFVPTNKAFRKVRQDISFTDMIRQPWRTQQILRQHMLIGQKTLEDLQKFDQYYTLQGNVAELQIRGGGDVFRYRIRGHDTRAKVIVRDLPASNGIIHVVNEVLINEPVIAGDIGKTALQLIEEEGRFNRMQTLISSLGVGHLFEQDNITVFAPENGGLDGLPEGTLNYLTTEEEGKAKLRTLLENHIFPGKIPITDLINTRRIRSIANYAFDVTVSDMGRVQLGGKVNVSQVNIPCKNAVYYHVDRPLIPDELADLLPSRCDIVTNTTVKGRCSKCGGEIQCPADSFFTGEITEYCYYWGMVDDTPASIPGCQPQCWRTNKIPSCCSGFYGPNCQPCPGGHKDPCSGRGKCSDMIWGAGVCICNSSFRGDRCEQCLLSNKFGPNCTDTCTCINGRCRGGPGGDGKCLPGTCYPGYRGENCDLMLKKCTKSMRLFLCHAKAQCVEQDEGQKKCECLAGYEGDGQVCTEIDPCSKPQRGNCHTQARCTKIGPGANQCSCDKGWYGDGFNCLPVMPCNATDHCHSNAQCINIQPGVYTCKCSKGFGGNGTECSEIDGCLLNNGGCHPLGKCTATGLGTVNCSCPEGYYGDGARCLTTIAGLIVAHPNLTFVARLIQKEDKKDLFLAQTSENLTFFSPTDDAMQKFMTQQSVGSDYFDDDVNIMNFLSFHTINKDYTVADMLALETTPGLRRLETLYDGFSLRLLSSNTTVSVLSSQTSLAAFVGSNIEAVNGYMHIIDSVLEPFVSDSDLPFLPEFFEKNTQYSEFGRWLQDKGLATQLQSMDRYTLLVPDNEVFRPELIGRTITADYLKYYALPSIILTVALDNGQEVATLLGERHQLQFTLNSSQVLVNGVPVIRSNILTIGGVIHTISGLLHPVINFCNKTSYKTEFGLCGACETPDVLQCMAGFVKAPSGYVQRYRCKYYVRDRYKLLHSYLGCQVLCEQAINIKQCCTGHYGELCQECPGGPEVPCGGETRGTCDEGVGGTGLCVCDRRYQGDRCQRCKVSGMAGAFCNISMDSCAYQNGNCSLRAVCTDSASGQGVHCRCRQGYVGDGYTCTSPCDVMNGGCHANATCSIENENHTVSCTCKDGFHGNGTRCQANVDPCAVPESRACSPYAQCLYAPPPVTSQDEGTVTCSCRRDYVGNGTLCVTTQLDALSQIAAAQLFYSDVINKADAADIKLLLADRQSTLTVFVPANAAVTNLSDYLAEDVLLVGNDIAVANDTNDVIVSNVIMSLSGKPLALSLRDGQYFMNGSRLTDINILALNGYINILEGPFVDEELKTNSEAPSSVLNIVVPAVVAAVVVLLVIVAIVVFYRRSQATGFLDIVKIFRTGSDASMSFARLKVQEAEDEVMGNPFTLPDNVNFDNPLYNDPDETQ